MSGPSCTFSEADFRSKAPQHRAVICPYYHYICGQTSCVPSIGFSADLPPVVTEGLVNASREEVWRGLDNAGRNALMACAGRGH